MVGQALGMLKDPGQLHGRGRIWIEFELKISLFLHLTVDL